MTEQSEFIVKLNQLLDEVGTITQDESKEAYNLIKDRLRESKRLLVRSKGMCLNCQSVEIEYGYPSKTHLGKGDEWIDNLFNNWVRPPRVQAKMEKWEREPNITINGLALNTITPYICPECADEIRGLAEKAISHRHELNTEQARNQQENELAIIRGEKKATAAKRYWSLLRYIQVIETEKLKELPYREFLNTIYWSIVRNYVVYRRGYRCELCGGHQNLNVHHKTYENHGAEHSNLNDLILLCHNCHAKFHDKFYEPET